MTGEPEDRPDENDRDPRAAADAWIDEHGPRAVCVWTVSMWLGQTLIQFTQKAEQYTILSVSWEVLLNSWLGQTLAALVIWMIWPLLRRAGRWRVTIAGVIYGLGLFGNLGGLLSRPWFFAMAVCVGVALMEFCSFMVRRSYRRAKVT